MGYLQGALNKTKINFLGIVHVAKINLNAILTFPS